MVVHGTGQPECAYYLRHGRCGFGPSCKFHHPEPGKAGSTASQEQPATATNAATADAADPAALVPAGPETAAPQPDAVSLPEVQVSVAEQQPDQAASTSALSPQPSSSPAPSAHSAQSMPQMGPQLAVLPPQYVMTLDGAGQAPQSQPQAQQEMQSQPHCLQLGVTGQSSSTPQVQLSAALQLSAAQQLQPQGQTLLSPIQASQSPHVTPATPTASKLPQAVTQAAVSAQPPAGTQQGMAPQLQLQPSSQVATAWLPAATLQPLTGTTAAGEQATPVSTSAQPHLPLPTPTAPQTSAFLPVASVTMQPQLGLHQGIAALPSTLRQQGHLARRSASVPEGSLPAMQPSTQGFLGQPLQAAPASFIPSAGLPMLPSPPQPQRPQQGLMTQPQQPVTQLQSQPQPQQPVTQPQVQHVVTQPQVQQLVVQPQVQQVVTQPQLHPQLQPQQLVAQGHEQVASPQTAPVAQAAAGLRSLLASLHPKSLLAYTQYMPYCLAHCAKFRFQVSSPSISGTPVSHALCWSMIGNHAWHTVSCLAHCTCVDWQVCRCFNSSQWCWPKGRSCSQLSKGQGWPRQPHKAWCPFRCRHRP